MPVKKKNILFVCTGNSCRSIMAEAYMRHRAGELGLPYDVRSAGTSTYDGLRPSREALALLEEEGVDIDGLESKKISREMIKWADVILVMEPLHREAVISGMPQAAEKVFLLGDFPNGSTDKSVPDPVGRTINYYKVTYNLITSSVEGLIKWLKRSQ
jgi:protein-tyrosine-phosphatase